MKNFKDQLHEYTQWRELLIKSINEYKAWRASYGFENQSSSDLITSITDNLGNDRVTLAFAAEFSRGKTELINALFFAETGVRLLPSSPGRTTMCPTELFYDADEGGFIKLLNIETRLDEISLAEFKGMQSVWKKIPLDTASPEQMQEAFKELAATKEVSFKVAEDMGLISKAEFKEGQPLPETVEIPCWRHALISFPHALLKEGLCILDTPGLNALGTEPELTISMLPNAQAILFVVGADTGVTKSDLDIWENHINKSKDSGKQCLAVVMNKIDAIADELSSPTKHAEAINKQVSEISRILDVNPKMIFPISAKQGLLGKVKDNPEILKESRLGNLERYLSDEILDGRRSILTRSVERDIGMMVRESISITSGRLANAEKELEDFKKTDFENTEITGKLMAETRDRQNAYTANVENFKTSAQVFNSQTQTLVDSLSRERIDEVIMRTKREMSSSKTTYGMKKAMVNLLDEMKDLLQDAVDLADETTRLTTAISKKFQAEHGFKELEIPSFQIDEFQRELVKILEEGELFSQSAKTVMTEKNIVVNKLYGTLINRARDVIKQAHRAAATWRNSALSPLFHQIKDHKKQIKARLEMLKKINRSKGSVEENIKLLEKELFLLSRQYDELQAIKAKILPDNS